MQSGRAFPDSITDTYSVHQLLGAGCFGQVFLARDRYCGRTYALKVIDKSSQPVSNEAKVMYQLSHPHITQCVEQVETNKKFYIVMEYMRGGTLADRLEDEMFSENLAKIYFFQMCLAVQYLHEKNVTHRDLKPDNMLLASNDRVTLLKISDFGLSNYCSNYNYSSVGHKSYVAPEVVRQFKYGKKVDIWSLGVVLYECVSGDFPFQSQSAMLQGSYCFHGYRWANVSTDVKAILKSILKVDPTRRCNITYVLKSPWLDDYDMRDTVLSLRQRFK